MKIAFLLSRARDYPLVGSEVTHPSNMFWGMRELARRGHEVIECAFHPALTQRFAPRPAKPDLLFYLRGLWAWREEINRAAVAYCYARNQAVAYVLLQRLGVLRPPLAFLLVGSKFLGSGGGVVTAAKRLVYRWIFERIALTHALTGEDSDDVGTKLRLSRPIPWWPLGIDCDYYQPARPSDSPPFVLAVGNDPGRDWPRLAEIAAQVPVAFKAVTKPAAVSGTTFPPNVEVIFESPMTATRRLFQTCTVNLCLTHPNNYGSGMTTVMCGSACGRPTIWDDPLAADYGYVDGESIDLVPRGEVARAVTALRRILDDPARAERLGLQARTVARRRSMDGYVDRLESELKNIAGA